MGWARGFESGSRAMGDIINTYYQAKERKELADIAKAKPEEMQGFTAEQGADLEAAAKSGQYDIGFDDAKQAYTVTPKADPTQTGVMAQQGVTDFMGTRTAGSMNPDQVNSARERAMAGVIMKRDPLQGMRMMREITQAGRDDKRWDRQTKQWGVEDADRAEKEADKVFSKNLEGEVGDWFKTRLAGPDGQPREATVDDHLAASQFKAAKLAGAGKLDQAGQIMKDYNAQSLVKIQLESAQRNEELGKAAAALAGGDLGPVKEFYNRFTPDGAQVTNITRGKSGEIVIERSTDDGRPLPPTVMKDQGQILAALNTFKDPMALYNWSQNEFKNNLAINADKRAANADGRAGAQFSQGQTDRKQTEAARTAEYNLWKEQNPNATPVQDAAAKARILKPKTSDGTEEIISNFERNDTQGGGTVVQRDKRGNMFLTPIDRDGKPGKTVVITPPGKAASGPTQKPTASHIAALIKSPDLSDQFDAKFGKGAAQAALASAKPNADTQPAAPVAIAQKVAPQPSQQPQAKTQQQPVRLPSESFDAYKARVMEFDRQRRAGQDSIDEIERQKREQKREQKMRANAESLQQFGMR